MNNADQSALKIYVASSWRNAIQPSIIVFLREAGHEVYDFRNPTSGDKGFAWSDIDPEWESWSPEQWRDGLNHPLAVAGLKNDFDAMKWADLCVLVLPSGRSSHIEAGWMKGAGKRVLTLALESCEPDLMYKVFDGICTSVDELLQQLETIKPKP